MTFGILLFLCGVFKKKIAEYLRNIRYAVLDFIDETCDCLRRDQHHSAASYHRANSLSTNRSNSTRRTTTGGGGGVRLTKNPYYRPGEDDKSLKRHFDYFKGSMRRTPTMTRKNTTPKASPPPPQSSKHSAPADATRLNKLPRALFGSPLKFFTPKRVVELQVNSVN